MYKYILKQFGKENYEGVAYFNFDHDESLYNVFENTKDPKRILEQLTFIYGKAIIPGKTLIIFDEIQECPNALNSLKYFQEEANEYHIVCAGSLLGIRLSHTSFPVGKVEFLNMYPMTFSEFLIADNCESLVNYMKSIKNILKAYESDFSKHAQNNEANKISLIWNSIPSQLAKKNKKFLYQTIKEGARAREYENALNWLNDANLIYKIYNVTKTDLPLIAYNDLSAFKIYMNDVGLLRSMANLDSKIVIEGDKLFREFKGAFTENYVLNMLNVIFDSVPNYFTFDRHEIDFVIQYKNEIIPIEVKANKSTNNISLTRYNEKYNNNFSIRFSMNNLNKDGKVINIPLFLIEYIKNLISDFEY